MIPDDDNGMPVGLLVAGDPGGWSMDPYQTTLFGMILAGRQSWEMQPGRLLKGSTKLRWPLQCANSLVI
jgi:hypothetical protein